MSHTLLNYAFLLFWSIFVEIHRELFFLDIKCLSQKRALKNSETWFFWPCLIGKNPAENLDLFKQMFLIKPVYGNKSQQKLFFLHKVRHILLNYVFLLFWSIFVEIHRELFFLDIKVAISETSTEKLRKFVFLTIFERGKSWEKFNFFKQFFLNIPLKWDKY